MSFNRAETEELKKLSKECFGASSRYSKILANGTVEPVEREREVVVPDGRGGVKTKTFVDKKNVIKRYTLEEVKQLMLDILEIRRNQYAAIETIGKPENPDSA